MDFLIALNYQMKPAKTAIVDQQLVMVNEHGMAAWLFLFLRKLCSTTA